MRKDLANTTVENYSIDYLDIYLGMLKLVLYDEEIENAKFAGAL